MRWQGFARRRTLCGLAFFMIDAVSRCLSSRQAKRAGVPPGGGGPSDARQGRTRAADAEPREASDRRSEGTQPEQGVAAATPQRRRGRRRSDNACYVIGAPERRPTLNRLHNSHYRMTRPLRGRYCGQTCSDRTGRRHDALRAAGGGPMHAACRRLERRVAGGCVQVRTGRFFEAVLVAGALFQGGNPCIEECCTSACVCDRVRFCQLNIAEFAELTDSCGLAVSNLKHHPK